MRKISKAMFFVCLLFLMSMPVLATPVISVTGSADVFYTTDANSILAVGWNQATAFSGVGVISIDFLDASYFDLSRPGVYSAYLTNQIGAGTTALANELAFTTFSAGPDLSSIVLWNDLLLDAGPYYLTIGLKNPNASSQGNWGATTPDVIFNPNPVTFAAGVTDLGQFFAQSPNLASYLPASTFTADTSTGARLLYDVQSLSPTSVPEPSTLLLMTFGSVFGLLALGLRRT